MERNTAGPAKILWFTIPRRSRTTVPMRIKSTDRLTPSRLVLRSDSEVADERSRSCGDQKNKKMITGVLRVLYIQQQNCCINSIMTMIFVCLCLHLKEPLLYFYRVYPTDPVQ